MKILIINYRYFNSGGPERYLFGLKSKLEKKGHRVIPFSIKSPKNEITEYEKCFAEPIADGNQVYFEDYSKNIKTFFTVLARQFFSFSVKRKLEKLIQNEKPDVCLILHQVNKLSPSVILACKKYNIPVVHRLSDYFLICPQGGLYSNKQFCTDCERTSFNVIKNRCIKKSYLLSAVKFFAFNFHRMINVYSHVDRFIATNAFMKKSLVNNGFNGGKIQVIPTFIDENLWEDLPAKAVDPADKIKFIHACNLDESKGTFDLLSAVKRLTGHTDNFELLIVGGRRESELKKIKRFIQSYELNAFVCLKPLQDHIGLQKLYHDSHVSILPTRWVENLPNAMLESLFFNLPVIVPNFGSFAVSVSDEVSYKFRHHDIDDLSLTMAGIVNNTELLNQKRFKCKPYARKNFNAENHVNEVLNLFENMIK